MYDEHNQELAWLSILWTYLREHKSSTGDPNGDLSAKILESYEVNHDHEECAVNQ